MSVSVTRTFSPQIYIFHNLKKLHFVLGLVTACLKLNLQQGGRERVKNFNSADLSIDAMDVSGEHQLDVLHSVFKQRLATDGQPIEEPVEQYQMAGGEEGGEEGKEGEGQVAVAEEKKCGR